MGYTPVQPPGTRLRTASNDTLQAVMGAAEAELGFDEPVKLSVKRVLESNPAPELQAWSAIALARAGDSMGAEQLIDRLKNQYPLNTMVNYGVQTASAAIKLNRNHPEEALELLEPTSRYEYSEEWNMYAVYIRGLSYLQLHRGREAAGDFQEILDHRGVVLNNVWGALAHLGLARAYAMQGDTAKARAKYEDFLNLWKDADPDVPFLQQAKAEYGKLP